MKIKLIAPLFAVVLASPVLADKPEWAGKGKPTAEQKAAHRSAMEAIEGLDEELEEETKAVKDKSKNKNKANKERTEKVKGLEKQKQKKLNQEQKELDKGSEKGRESRENRKKWWQFWGD